MKHMTITNEVYRAIEKLSYNQFKDDGMANDDGTWTVPLDDDVHKFIEDMRFEQETFGDAILRMLTKGVRH